MWGTSGAFPRAGSAMWGTSRGFPTCRERDVGYIEGIPMCRERDVGYMEFAHILVLLFNSLDCYRYIEDGETPIL